MAKKPSSHKISRKAKADLAAAEAKLPVIQTADGLRVFCAFTRLVPVADLKPNPKNDNEHPPEQLAIAAKIFQRGIRRPIRVSARSGLITVGHGALETAKLKGWTEWPVEIQEYATEKDELADLVADNKLGLKARSNPHKLKLLLEELAGGDESDIEIAAVTDAEMRALIDILNPPPTTPDKPKDAKSVTIDAMYQVIVECKTEADQKTTLEKLEKEGLKCRLLTL